MGSVIIMTELKATPVHSRFKFAFSASDQYGTCLSVKDGEMPLESWTLCSEEALGQTISEVVALLQPREDDFYHKRYRYSFLVNLYGTHENSLAPARYVPYSMNLSVAQKTDERA
jgi:hypothetical protein